MNANSDYCFRTTRDYSRLLETTVSNPEGILASDRRNKSRASRAKCIARNNDAQISMMINWLLGHHLKQKQSAA